MNKLKESNKELLIMMFVVVVASIPVYLFSANKHYMFLCGILAILAVSGLNQKN